jgi:hypothetical protein
MPTAKGNCQTRGKRGGIKGEISYERNPNIDTVLSNAMRNCILKLALGAQWKFVYLVVRGFAVLFVDPRVHFSADPDRASRRSIDFAKSTAACAQIQRTAIIHELSTRATRLGTKMARFLATLSIALSSLRMRATSATFGHLPAAKNRS